MRAVTQFAGGDLDLGRQAQAGELIRGASVVLYRQQVGAGAAAAGIQLDPEQAQSVEAETDAAFAVAGLQIEPEALTPFFPLVLSRAFTEVAVEVDVGGAQAGLAVGDEVGVGSGGEQSGTDGKAKQMNRR